MVAVSVLFVLSLSVSSALTVALFKYVPLANTVATISMVAVALFAKLPIVHSPVRLS